MEDIIVKTLFTVNHLQLSTVSKEQLLIILKGASEPLFSSLPYSTQKSYQIMENALLHLQSLCKRFKAQMIFDRVKADILFDQRSFLEGVKKHDLVELQISLLLVEACKQLILSGTPLHGASSKEGVLSLFRFVISQLVSFRVISEEIGDFQVSYLEHYIPMDVLRFPNEVVLEQESVSNVTALSSKNGLPEFLRSGTEERN
jgi:hypothetical protein